MLFLLLTACVPLDVQELQTPVPSPGPVVPRPYREVPEPTIYSIVPRPANTPKARSVEDELATGRHPLTGALPGSEQVLLKIDRVGSFNFPLPEHEAGEVMWFLVRCSERASVLVETTNLSGGVTVSFLFESCHSAQYGRGALNAAARRGRLEVRDGVAVTLTIISTRLSPAYQRACSYYVKFC